MTERMRIKGSGNVGIGTSTPGFPLSFTNTLGDKISLWGQSTNTYGFGVQGNLLQIHSDVTNSDIAFGYGSSSSLTELVRIKSSGNMGIGTTNPLQMLHLKRDTNPGIRLENSVNAFDIYNENAGNGLIFIQIGQSGFFKIRGDGTTVSGSDRRLKKNISTLENVLDRVAQLRPVRYQMKEETGSVPTHIGFIAQEVEPIFPEFVSEANGFKGLAYADMVSIAIAAVKELNQTVEKQKTALSEQSEKMNGVAKELADLKKQLAVQTQAQAELLAKDHAREDRVLALERLVHEHNSETASLKAQ
jgi:hypothetical protein